MMDSSPKAVLCLCHDELTLRIRRMLLEHFGYTVLSSRSVTQMHSVLSSECPDMLLLDTSDPSLDCEEVAGAAKELCPGILSVVLTPEYGQPINGTGSIDRYLKLDAPREQWLAGIESLFEENSEEDSTTVT
jgi:CheY-like chemotaxis protein